MSQIYLIDQLSEALGRRLRKEKRPGVFPLIAGALERFDVAALESFEYLIFPQDASMYGTDESGNIRYLICFDMNLVAARVIRQMEQLELLFMLSSEPWGGSKVPVSVDEIEILSALPNLKYLAISLEDDENLVLSYIGRMKR